MPGQHPSAASATRATCATVAASTPTTASTPTAATGALRARGFTLVEVSLALWILIVVLLVGIALVLQQPRVVRRLDAERQAVAVMDWTLEEMRAGIIPLQTTPDVGWPLSSFVVGSPAPDLKIGVTVTPQGTPSLYVVVLLARYTVYGQARQRRLQTMIWRPGGGP